MVGITVPQTPSDDRIYGPQGENYVPNTWAQGMDAQIGLDFHTQGITPNALRWADRHWNNTDSPTLSPEQANAQYGIPDGLSFDEPITAYAAQERKGQYLDNQQRQRIVDRSGLGFVGRLSAGFLAGVADPVNLGFAIAPEMLLTRMGFAPAAGAAFGERVAFGAISGATGNAMLMPANAFFATEEGRQYTAGDMLMDLTVGAAIGGAIPAITGAIPALRARRAEIDAQRIADALPATNPIRALHSTPEMQLEGLSTSLTQKLHGYPVDVTPTITAHGGYQTDVLRAVDDSIHDATWRAADVLERTTEGLTAAQARKAGLQPYGVVGGQRGDTRIVVQWKDGGGGTVAGDDLRNVERISGTMTPVEETENSMLWRTKRSPDGRIVETRLEQGMDNGQPAEKWTVSVVPKQRDQQLSTFIGDSARTEGQFTGTDARVQYDHMPLPNIVDDTNLPPTRAGVTITPGEQQTPGTAYQYVSTPPVVGSSVNRAMLDEMQTLIDSVPKTESAIRAPGQAIGESTKVTRELDDLMKEDEGVLKALREQGRVSAADEKGLEGIDEVDAGAKERADVRNLAAVCLQQNGLGG